MATEWDTKGFFPAVKGKMRKMALHITSPDYDGNVSKACKDMGVSRSTFYRWQHDGNYIEFVRWLIEEYTKNEEANVWRAVIKKAKAGDTKAQKLYMELIGRYRQTFDVNVPVVIEGEKDLE